jgi:glucose/arabinose dehydrogenase
MDVGWRRLIILLIVLMVRIDHEARRALLPIQATVISQITVEYQVYMPVVVQAQPSMGPVGFNAAVTTVRLDLVVSGLREPTGTAHAGDGSGRLFVLEKAGRIRIVLNDMLLAEPFLDIVPLVGRGGWEQGLLGLAFHPAYRHNGLFYIAYTAPDNSIIVARYSVSNSPNHADAASAITLLSIEKQPTEHNGGQLAFGPDGYLYIGIGDGGLQGDPTGNAQASNTLFGKILRIDVSGDPYAIPPDNPFVQNDQYRPEIWALGLRNPWRFSFDRLTGDLYSGDVGQERYEEINFQPAASRGGANYGWNVMEASQCYLQTTCDKEQFVLPIAEFEHFDEWNAVIGGYVYRGWAQPSLWGAYFFADTWTGRLWALSRPEKGGWSQTMLLERSVMTSSFGEDEAGEIYLTAHDDGDLYRLVAVPRH